MIGNSLFIHLASFVLGALLLVLLGVPPYKIAMWKHLRPIDWVVFSFLGFPLLFLFLVPRWRLSCSPLIGPPLMRLTPSSEPAN